MQAGNTVDPRILQELRPGEQLLWWAQPDPKRRANRGQLLANTWTLWSVIAIAVITILLTVYNLFLQSTANYFDTSSLLYSIVFILLMCIIVVRRLPFLARGRTQDIRNTVYAITNYRVIVITTKNQYIVNSHTKNDIGRIDRVERSDGYGDVTYGLPQTVAASYGAITGKATLSGIPDVRTVEALMIQTFKSDSSTPAPTAVQQ